MGWGRRRGGGWRHSYRATGLPGWARAGAVLQQGLTPHMPFVAPSPEVEKQILENQVAALAAQLDVARKLLGEAIKRASDEKS